ncbi:MULTISPECIES: helix-turn-helix domain-containing protein [Pseudonocardia]|nr:MULTISPECIES: helix-turn-helix domain-containing protein [Pseudonocardia]MCF7550605.1 helix-turn-helix transcriptional regulator [Pseudonocardia sp. WMMC193]
MVLPRDYTRQNCSMARALEIVGERWTLLIVRDAFFGVRRFSDFSRHLDVPRAVLTERLGLLVAEGVLEREPGPRGGYLLTDKGRALWPVLRALVGWGDEYCAPRGPRRLFDHAGCGGRIDPDGRCRDCGAAVAAADTVMSPGPGFDPPVGDEVVTAALARPRRLLEPIR